MLQKNYSPTNPFLCLIYISDFLQTFVSRLTSSILHAKFMLGFMLFDSVLTSKSADFKSTKWGLTPICFNIQKKPEIITTTLLPFIFLCINWTVDVPPDLGEFTALLQAEQGVPVRGRAFVKHFEGNSIFWQVLLAIWFLNLGNAGLGKQKRLSGISKCYHLWILLGRTAEMSFWG